jgi:hypothetical protein
MTNRVRDDDESNTLCFREGATAWSVKTRLTPLLTTVEAAGLAAAFFADALPREANHEALGVGGRRRYDFVE